MALDVQGMKRCCYLVAGINSRFVFEGKILSTFWNSRILVNMESDVTARSRVTLSSSHMMTEKAAPTPLPQTATNQQSKQPHPPPLRTNRQQSAPIPQQGHQQGHQQHRQQHRQQWPRLTRQLLRAAVHQRMRMTTCALTSSRLSSRFVDADVML